METLPLHLIAGLFGAVALWGAVQWWRCPANDLALGRYAVLFWAYALLATGTGLLARRGL